MQASNSSVNPMGMLIMSFVPIVALAVLLAMPGDDYGKAKLLAGLVAVVWCGIPSIGFWANRLTGHSEFESPKTTCTSKPTFCGQLLDRANEFIRSRILDLRIGPEPNEFTAPNSEDIRLRPLDRQAFEQRMRPRLADSLEVAAEVLSKPASDRELAECSEQLNKVADSFRWNLLEVAMELRTAENAGESDKKETQPPATPASWAKKFRLMCAGGF